MKMRRSCNLELRLFPSHDSGHNPMVGEGNKNNSEREMSAAEDEGQQQKLTMIYDGKVCVSDVTDLQARWIMKQASKEMAAEEKNMKLNRSLSQSQREMCSPKNNNNSNNNKNNNNNNNTSSLSMQRSLQRFLQKRRDRILHSRHPYHP